ncbi:hypothetical protein HELRODRAFT_170146 [Helobdella robusta]|uniref:NADP-dependent oxidoreductase domain-containing protein n=1 Tax=Helobdella robusta TaxID=6412 RepID=T1F2Q0_HELRO|nr:hypothetical protein HELRODRAFT_170146 [Helobdella robusta]ESO07602.1 hypothetical protein HELRODRAFT_170146 [Helobdella robusta]
MSHLSKEKCSDYPDGLSVVSTIKLNDGVDMPLFGLGLYLSRPGGEAEEATYIALKSGYRLLDTAQIYGSVGVSNFEVQHLKGLKRSGLPVPSVNQIELHIFQRREYLVDYCRNNKIAVMGYSPLARGFLLDNPVVVEKAQK